jgi:molybdopterin molybdotransferase
MISVTEAIQLIQQNISPTATETLPLAKCINRVLAKDIHSSINMPAFHQSGMDGYAFRMQDYSPTTSLEIVAAIPAGDKNTISILPLQAARIFTGAPLPEFADTVVMQEKTTVTNNQLFITDTDLQKGSNVRPAGSEIKVGELALSAGTRLTPAAIGMLAAIGETEATVHKIPSVAIIITGNELQMPGLPLQRGNVYESNSYMLIAALEEMGIKHIELLYAADDLEELTQQLKEALQYADVVLLTGGVSVGDFDFVVKATALCGVENIFHKIKQKPGKPFFFGKKNHQLIFGFPGNPSSVLACFYEYVVMALQQMQAQSNPGLTQAFLPLANSYSKKAGLTHFLKASTDGQKVTLLGAQESYRLSSFAIANCLACIPENATNLAEGTIVEVHFL